MKGMQVSSNALRVNRVNYPHLDMVKLVMAFLVVQIHTNPFVDIPAANFVAKGVQNLAVPFFFLASAFLCFRGLNIKGFSTASSVESTRVRKTIIKLLQLYIIWTVLYLPVTVFGSVLLERSLLRAVASFARGAVLVGENFCSYQLWYLLASVVAFALVYLFLRGGGHFKAPFGGFCLFTSCGIFAYGSK